MHHNYNLSRIFTHIFPVCTHSTRVCNKLVIHKLPHSIAENESPQIFRFILKNLFLLYLNVLSLTSFSGSNCYNEKSHKTKMNSLPKVIFLLIKQLKAMPAYTLLHMPHSNNTQTYFHTYIRPNDAFTSGRAFLQ